MRSLGALIVVVGCGTSAAAHAAGGHWSSIGGPPSAEVGPLVLLSSPAAPDVLWTQSGYPHSWFWRSDDHGRHWQLTTGQPAGRLGLVPDPLQAGAGWAWGEAQGRAGNLILRTSDGGATWPETPVDSPFAASEIVASTVSRNELIGWGYGSYDTGGVERSSDGGSTWQPVVGCQGGAMKVAPSDGTIYCHDDRALHRVLPDGSVDEPTHFQGANLIAAMYDLMIAPGDSHVLYASAQFRDGLGLARSLDGGQSWEELTNPSPDRPGTSGSCCVLLAVDARRPERLRVLSVDFDDAFTYFHWYMQRSEDGGHTWAPRQTVPTRGLLVDPANIDQLYYWDDSALMASSDAGQSWEHWGGLPQHGELASLQAGLGPRGESEIFGLTRLNHDALARSHDGGRSWRVLPLPQDVSVHQLRLDGTHPGRLYAVGGGLLRSDDLGQSWSTVPVASRLQAREVAIDSREGRTLYLTSAADVWASHDGGDTWAKQRRGPRLSEGRSLVIDAEDAYRAWVLSRTDEGWDVLHTTDGGVSWHRSITGLPRAAYPMSLLRLASGELLVGSGAGVYASPDGLRWRRVSLSQVAPQVEDTAAGVLYGTGSSYLVVLDRGQQFFRSVDDGRTWKPIACGLPPGAPGELALDPVHPGGLLASLENLGLWQGQFVRACPRALPP